MRYQGSEARNLEREDYGRERELRPSFSVVEGGGLDARARRAVSEGFLSRTRVLVCIACTLIAVGAICVALSAAAASCLGRNVDLRDQIQQAERVNGELQVQRSQLSSSARIDRIATENYGMVRATTSDTIDLSNQDGASDAAQASADDGASGASASSADAAQSTSEAGQDAPAA